MLADNRIKKENLYVNVDKFMLESRATQVPNFSKSPPQYSDPYPIDRNSPLIKSPSKQRFGQSAMHQALDGVEH